MSTVLRYLDGSLAGREISLSDERTIVGSATDCDLKLEGERVGRHHCVLLQDKWTVRILDLGTDGGTFVNGKPIRGQTVLENGDLLQVGDVAFQLVSNNSVALAEAATSEASNSSAAVPQFAAPKPARSPRPNRALRSRVRCPHCWYEFPPHEVLWISAHPDLRGDPRVGEDAQLRFLPSRFNVAGQALDSNSVACHSLACPECHLMVSRALLEMKPLFFSILGAPGSGKSYFLASMVWQLRRSLSSWFQLAFSDADPESNQLLNSYEETLFLSPNPQTLVALPKTEKEGDLYEGVRVRNRTVWYPKPFVFTIRPNPDHPNASRAQSAARAICLYDNAGEHYLPGGDSAGNEATQHLSISQALFFVFDPTQHPQVRSRCATKSDDPQLHDHGWTHRQDQVLLEAASRIRNQTGLGQSEKYRRPLIVIVSKYDAWCGLTGGKILRSNQVLKETGSGLHAFDVARFKKISNQTRDILKKLTPEIVSAAESISDDVVYVPVSALGHSPEVAEQGGFLGIRPETIRPMWVQIPLIYALSQAAPHLVPVMNR